MRKLLVAITAAASVMAATPAPAQVEQVPVALPKGCTKFYTVHEYRKYATRYYRRNQISHRQYRWLGKLVRCQNPANKRLVKGIRKPLRARYKVRWRHSREYNVPYVLPWRIVRCESGGNWRAVNLTPAGIRAGRPAGAYQITTGTWRAYGGRQFAPTADLATPREQNVVVLRIWDGGAGAHHWECK